MDCSLAGSSVHGIFQERVLKWVAIAFSGDLPNPGIKPGSPALQADALNSEPPGIPSLVKEMPLEIKLLLQTSDAFLGLQGRLFWVTFFVFQVSNGH